MNLRGDYLTREAAASRDEPYHLGFDFGHPDFASTEPAIPANRPEKIVAVGHRGTKKFAPENTISAHESAVTLGARAIEFDIRCTRDGEFVLMHDRTVNRTTYGRGRVKNLTLAQVKALNIRTDKCPKFEEETVPTLREALRNVQNRFVVDIDFKGGPRHSAEILREVLIDEGFDRPGAPLVTIFARRHHFHLMKSLCPQFALRPHYISGWKTRDLIKNYPLEIMGLRRMSFSHRAAGHVNQANLKLFCNVMGKADNHLGFGDSVRAGARFIQTDHLDHLIPFLKKRNLLETRVLGRDYKPLLSPA